MLNKNSFGTLHNGNFHSVKRLSTSSSSAPVSWVRRQICLSCVCQTELCPEWSPLAGVSSFSPYYKVSKCYTHQNVILIKIKNTVQQHCTYLYKRYNIKTLHLQNIKTILALKSTSNFDRFNKDQIRKQCSNCHFHSFLVEYLFLLGKATALIIYIFIL